MCLSALFPSALLAWLDSGRLLSSGPAFAFAERWSREARASLAVAAQVVVVAVPMVSPLCGQREGSRRYQLLQLISKRR